MTTYEQTTNRQLRPLLQRLRVPLGFITALLFVFFSRPTWASLAAGIPIALLGALIRAWASGHLRKNAELAVSGPYAFTRNPLYFGSFIMAIGCAAGGGVLWLGILLAAFFIVIYMPVMRAEADHMSLLFAGAYPKWAARVPLFFPRLTPYRDGDHPGFDFRQYLHHREYRALIGLAVVMGILAMKAANLFQH
jgi:protein-S-isoprenylcysteine O-methyltransferase Ste14